MVLALQRLFVMMLYANKNVLDPSEAMESIVDSQGKHTIFISSKKIIKGKNVKVGEQSDISEFSINFFERIEEGLKLDARVDVKSSNILNTI